MPQSVSNAEEAKFTGKQMFLLPSGETYHLGTRQGEVAQRVVTVGSKGRAALLAEQLLDSVIMKKCSSRDMTVITGTYHNVPVSIIAIGMGAPMMDFMVREAVYCQPKPMAIIRIGTCGLLNPSLEAGTVVCASKGSSYCYTNYARFAGGCINWEPAGLQSAPHYLISKPILPTKELDAKLVSELRKVQGCSVVEGVNLCGETFYACQGRLGEDWAACNEHLVDEFEAGDFDSCEMEMHQLYHCASLLPKGRLQVAGCAIGIVSRTGDSGNITAAGLQATEVAAGRAAMEALIALEL